LVNAPSAESRILYLHEACLVLNKLPGEAVQSTASGIHDVSRILAVQIGETAQGKGFFPAAVHRLDVPVSGASLFARTPKALAFLNAAFAQGRIEKRYLAVIEKPPSSLALPETGELVHWIKTDTGRNKSVAYYEKVPGSKKAILHYRIKGYGDHYLFMEIDLLTGRHHQIRAQLARLGLHIKGDLKYGARRSEPAGGIRLHGYSLCFPKPTGRDEVISVTAPPPTRDRLWETFENL
jgi:23S rRNA pseudouridine1911/1915/1917 synthase